MEYRGYLGKVDFDAESGLFHGEVINTRDVITFQGKSVQELQRGMRDSVEDYLEFCQQRGEQPDKPFSGQFVTRVPAELHRQVNLAASLAGKSLNAWVTEQLQEAVSHMDGIVKLPSSPKSGKSKNQRSQPVVSKRTTRSKLSRKHQSV